MRIDPAGAQLLFVDLQTFLTAASATETPDVLSRTAAALAGAATRLRMPLTFSLVPDKNVASPQPVPALQKFATTANVFARQSASAFLDPSVDAALSGHNRATLVIAGFSAEVAILHSGLDAIEAGYQVYGVVDAIGGHSHRTEQAALNQLERAGAKLTSAISLLSSFAPDFSKAPGSDVLKDIMALGAARAA